MNYEEFYGICWKTQIQGQITIYKVQIIRFIYHISIFKIKMVNKKKKFRTFANVNNCTLIYDTGRKHIRRYKTERGDNS